MTRHNTLLDGMRGVAALAVVVLHASALIPGRPLPGAYLAVDFFFCLSGYVVTKAYGDRLNSGLGVVAFMRLRAIRLAPLYILASGLALALLTAKWAAGRVSAEQWLLQAPNVFLIPTPATAGALYPLNYVAWSLALEVLINLVWAATPSRARWIFPLAGGLLGAMLMVVAAFHFGSLDVGVKWKDAWGGVARILVAYSAGIMIFVALERHPIRPPSWSGGACIAIMMALFAVPVLPPYRPIFDLTVAFGIVPALVYICASVTGPLTSSRPLMLLGATSYGVYVIHLTVRDVFMIGAELAGVSPSPLALTLFLASVLAAAFLLDRYYDRAARDLLSSIGSPRRASRISSS